MFSRQCMEHRRRRPVDRRRDCGRGVALLASAESSRAWFVWVLLASMAGGALWASITAWLRDRFNANEILVSLMLVYVAQQLISWLVQGPWRDPNGYGFPQTELFAARTCRSSSKACG